MALFLSEFLYRAVREEAENRPLFAYLQHSIIWLDECGGGFANQRLEQNRLHCRLSRTRYCDKKRSPSGQLRIHIYNINPEEAGRLRHLMRMNYETMHLFGMSRAERARCLAIMNDYYQFFQYFQWFQSREIRQMQAIIVIHNGQATSTFRSRPIIVRMRHFIASRRRNLFIPFLLFPMTQTTKKMRPMPYFILKQSF